MRRARERSKIIVTEYRVYIEVEKSKHSRVKTLALSLPLTHIMRAVKKIDWKVFVLQAVTLHEN